MRRRPHIDSKFCECPACETKALFGAAYKCAHRLHHIGSRWVCENCNAVLTEVDRELLRKEREK